MDNENFHHVELYYFDINGYGREQFEYMLGNSSCLYQIKTFDSVDYEFTDECIVNQCDSTVHDYEDEFNRYKDKKWLTK